MQNKYYDDGGTRFVLENLWDVTKVLVPVATLIFSAIAAFK